ncbi:Hypothetical protein FKW44_020684 [Caligus rogercresseyi]|uniref:Uncharacterized protein n=1 Tax=Caligus rogercresseyi TaxID=217165 RepID=A0A7T8JUR9_CALRO|nr:Hypothetical protein FKW44_020684 [Caligus rogercresseyi]
MPHYRWSPRSRSRTLLRGALIRDLLKVNFESPVGTELAKDVSKDPEDKPFGDEHPKVEVQRERLKEGRRSGD